MESSHAPSNALMEKLLIELQAAAKIPAKSRLGRVNVIVDKVCSNAYENGISTSSLSRLINIITLPNELDQASLGALIRNLYPATKVPDTVVVNVVGSLGHGKAKPSYSVQVALLKWLIMIYDVLVNQSVLSQIYAILFNLLDSLAIRAPLCHILSLITRRKHVRPYRIQLLMELTRHFGGGEAPLVGLLRVYKDYYPDVIIGDAVAGRAKVFTHPNPEWQQKLAVIQDLNTERSRFGLTGYNGFSVSNTRGIAKRANRSSILPVVHTSNASEDSTTLEEIEDVGDFVQKLEKIEPPNQLVAVIGDPLLQKFIQLQSSKEYTKRVDRWLYAFFESEVQVAGQDTSTVLDMLQEILQYTQYTKTLPQACLAYFKSILPSWNGVTGCEVILSLLAYLPLESSNSFEELYADYFQPLEAALINDNDSTTQTRLLKFYTNLLDYWTTVTLSQLSQVKRHAETITALIEHSVLLTLNISQSDTSQHAASAILSFYESATSTISHPSLKTQVRIVTPPSQLVYALQFTASLSTLSRLCSILASYKRAFEVAMTPKAAGGGGKGAQTYQKNYVNHFNGFLMDVCNCIWRARALNTSDPNALGCLVQPTVTAALTTYISSPSTLTLPSLFSFSTSPTLSLLAIMYVREMEDLLVDGIVKRHAGPVGQASLKQLEQDGGLRLGWQEYKLGVLQYLDNAGVAGIGELMFNTMKHLMVAKDKKAQSYGKSDERS